MTYIYSCQQPGAACPGWWHESGFIHSPWWAGCLRRRGSVRDGKKRAGHLVPCAVERVAGRGTSCRTAKSENSRTTRLNEGAAFVSPPSPSPSPCAETIGHIQQAAVHAYPLSGSHERYPPSALAVQPWQYPLPALTSRKEEEIGSGAHCHVLDCRCSRLSLESLSDRHSILYGLSTQNDDGLKTRILL